MIPGTVSADNSSTTLLANAAAFTGTYEEVVDYSSVLVMIKSSHAGTLEVFFSPDQSNDDVTHSFSISANTTFIRSLPVAARYVKVKFTNSGGGTQTTMRLQTILSNRPAHNFESSDHLISNGQLVVPKFAFANVAASQTDSSLVAAVSGKRIRVINYTMVAGSTATNVTFNSKGGGAGTAITSLKANAANGGAAPGEALKGHFQTAVGEGLTVTTGAGSTVGIDITYVEV